MTSARPRVAVVGAGPSGLYAAAALAASHACVVWCPESERRLYGATTPVAILQAAGVRVGLGSDGTASGGRDYLSGLAAARREQSRRRVAR